MKSCVQLPGSKPPANYILWVISAVVGLMFAIVIGLIIIGAGLIASSARNITITPPKEPEVSEPADLPVKKNRFATDSAVLKLQADIGKLRQDIDSTDLFETQLSAPNLDLDIRIKIPDNP